MTMPARDTVTADQVAICKDFVRELQAGREPPIERYAERLSAGVREDFIRYAIEHEIDHLAQAGQRVSPSEYKKRFPNHLESIDCAINQVRSRMAYKLALRDRRRRKETVSNRGGPIEFGDYRIISEIGGGGMGRVYRAEIRGTRETIAIKRTHPNYSGLPGVADVFENEAATTAGLDHENIIRVYGSGEIDGILYLTMEIIDGINLWEIMRENVPIDVGLACEIVRQISGALAYAHDRGIVHRDVSPGNIVWGESGKAILIDFGLAKTITPSPGVVTADQGRAATRPPGTDGYIAPECWKGVDPDGRSDIYALGCVLYFLITGESPGEGADPFNQDALRHVPRGVRRILSKMTAVNPRDRYQDARRVIRAIAPFCPIFQPIESERASQDDFDLFDRVLNFPWREIFWGTASIPAFFAVVALTLYSKLPDEEIGHPGPERRLATSPQRSLMATKAATEESIEKSPPEEPGRAVASASVAIAASPKPSNPVETPRTPSSLDMTDKVRETIEKNYYYKLTGAGPKYFVTGFDIKLSHAEVVDGTLSITLSVQKADRGIELLGLGGHARLVFTSENNGSTRINIDSDHFKSKLFPEPGTLVVQIMDVARTLGPRFLNM